MKFWIILISLLITTLTSSLSQTKDVVRVACFSYPPNLITDRLGAEPGRPKGAIVQVWENYIAPEAGIKIQWVGPYPFTRAMAMLESGEADAIQHLSKTPDRLARFTFSDKPIMWGRQGIVVLKSERLREIRQPGEFGSRKIAMIGDGYLAPFLLRNKQKIDLIEIFGEDAGQKIIRMLLSGRIWGAYFTFPDVLLYYAALDGRLNDVKVISFPGSDSNEVTYAAMSRKLNPAITRRINSAISKVSGTYNYPGMTVKIFKEINR